jgi:hypothetical protein
LFDEPFVRVDPWLGLRFNLAMNKKIGLVLILLLGAGLNSFAQTSSTTGAPTAGIVAATKKFLATLDDAQRGKVVFDFKDEAQRKRWSNLPTAIFKRQGLRMGDLTNPQRDAALAVLAAALSPQGYTKIF